MKSFTSAWKNQLEQLKAQQIVSRIWQRDHTVWSASSEEISNRLGWLDAADRMREELPEINRLVEEIRADGYTHALLLGMGGSSLAPEVFRKVFGVAEGYLDLAVLDSTDPDAVRQQANRLDPTKTLFIVATKSGGTAETLSFFKYFYNWCRQYVDDEEVGEHFMAITDPGSKLVEIAAIFDFRATLLNDPNIGGRYSALSYFGVFPAALIGVDLGRLLESARQEAADARRADGPAAEVGAAMGTMALAGRDKITLLADENLAPFGDWAEQLIAESTGKSGKGILPVVGEALAAPALYGDDRFFVRLTVDGQDKLAAEMGALESAGYPVFRIAIDDLYDLGGQFFRWEFATAIAGHLLGIHPFNQPNVEAAKVLARQMIAAYQQSGQLPPAESAPVSSSALADFLAQARPGDYIALQAYLPPAPETTAALQKFRLALRERTHLATTLGYGPRFLHSTGQLHKGDSGNGLFIQLVSAPSEDLPIPDQAGQYDSSMDFGVLKQAQALGDYQALRQAAPPRRVIRFDLGQNPAEKLTDLGLK